MKIRSFKFGLSATVAMIFASLVSANHVYANAERQLEGLLQTIEASYAPISHKENYLGWNWKAKRAELLREARECRTSNDFYRIASKTLRTLRDAHVSISLPTDLKATLPVQVYPAGRGIYLSWISKEAMTKQHCRAKPGDELIAVDAQDIEKVLADLQTRHGVGNSGADRALMALELTSRKESEGWFEVSGLERSVAYLTFADAKTRRLHTCALKWEVKGNALLSRTLPEIDDPVEGVEVELEQPEFDRMLLGSAKSRLGGWAFWNDPRMKKIEELILSVDRLAKLRVDFEGTAPYTGKDKKEEVTDKGTKLSLGKAEPYYPLPENFEKIEFPMGLGSALQDNLHIGTFEQHGDRVGYLRVGSYVPGAVVVALFGLRHAIHQLEKNSDYLVIDQTFNPGGYVVYSDWLVRTLVGEYDDNLHMKFAFKPNARVVQSLNVVEMIMDELMAMANDDQKKWLEKNVNLQLALRHAKEDFQKVRDAYERNLSLTSPIRLYSTSVVVEELLSYFIQTSKIVRTAVDMLSRAPISDHVRYTKPVYFVINELDFSGGDATPAGLQDYGRVTLVGKTTAGAGGSVGAYSLSQGEPFQFRLTESLMIRSGPQRLVENYGVTPDLEFGITQQDLAEEFENYFSRLMQLINSHRQSF